jgi:uncharacterized protein (TIGR02996 family)
MPIDDEFLETIRANPAADLPRLVYADWLDEQGDPRGEFIRIQCELAKIKDDDPRRWDLELRQGRLLRWYGWQWWYKPFSPHATRPRFSRGFIEERWLSVEVDDLLSQPEVVFRNYPFLEDLILTGVEDRHLPRLVDLTFLDRLKTLRGEPRFGTPLARTVVRNALKARFGDRVI